MPIPSQDISTLVLNTVYDSSFAGRSSQTHLSFTPTFTSTCAVNRTSCGRPILFSFGESAWCGAGWRRAASRESPIVRMREFQGGIFLIDRTILSGKTSVQNVMYLSFISDHLD